MFVAGLEEKSGPAAVGHLVGFGLASLDDDDDKHGLSRLCLHAVQKS